MDPKRDTGVAYPQSLQRHVKRQEVHHRWTAVQIADLVLISMHAEVAENQAALERTRATMMEITRCLEAWAKRGEWNKVIIGTDLNAQVQRGEAEVTGEDVLQGYGQQRRVKRYRKCA